jgi:hypothetical protein
MKDLAATFLGDDLPGLGLVADDKAMRYKSVDGSDLLALPRSFQS